MIFWEPSLVSMQCSHTCINTRVRLDLNQGEQQKLWNPYLSSCLSTLVLLLLPVPPSSSLFFSAFLVHYRHVITTKLPGIEIFVVRRLMKFIVDIPIFFPLYLVESTNYMPRFVESRFRFFLSEHIAPCMFFYFR